MPLFLVKYCKLLPALLLNFRFQAIMILQLSSHFCWKSYIRSNLLLWTVLRKRTISPEIQRIPFWPRAFMRMVLNLGMLFLLLFFRSVNFFLFCVVFRHIWRLTFWEWFSQLVIDSCPFLSILVHTWSNLVVLGRPWSSLVVLGRPWSSLVALGCTLCK